MIRLLLLAPAALALGTARPPTPPEEAPVLAYQPVEAGTEVTYTIAAPAPTPPPEAEPPETALKVIVSLPQQRAYVVKDGFLVESAPVSTGRKGHPTPVGTFRILEKQVHHRSNIYSNAPMPFMQRLTTYGIALHAGPLPGYPASHGCIRLPMGFAKKLFSMTDRATRVTITREPVRLEDASESAD